MSLNLSNRILTSLILLVVLFICLFFSKFLWLYLLIVVSIISYREFRNLIIKTYKKNKNKTFFFNSISLIYLLIFIFIGYDLYKFSPLYLLFILSICIFSDTGGYLVGNLIGGKRLTKISPNKTISGSIGSFIFSVFPLLIILILSDNYNLPELLINNILNNIFYIIFGCLFLSLICQLGDLFISYFKRKAKLKDTGSLLPGHGGLLDRIDGLIFVLPAAYLLKLILI